MFLFQKTTQEIYLTFPIDDESDDDDAKGGKKKWPEAKFGGNDRGFHLEANMSGLQAAAAAH